MSIRNKLQITVVILGSLLGTYFVVTTLQPPLRKSSSERRREPEKEHALQQVAASPSTAPSAELKPDPGPEAEPPPAEHVADIAAEAEAERFVGFPESSQETMARLDERAELSNRWDGETQDPGWTGEIEDRIRGLLSNAELQENLLKEVDCRESICRFQLATGENTHSEVMSLIHVARDLMEETWVRAEPNEELGQSQIEVFFPKEGFRLSGGGGPIEDSAEIGVPSKEPDLAAESG